MSQMSRARQIGGTVGAYGLGLVVARLSSIAVLPVLARAVPPAELGTFATLSSATLIAYIVLADFGLGEAALRLAGEGNEAERLSLFKTVAGLRVALGLTVASLLVLFAGPLSLLLTGSPDAARYAPLLGASVLLGALARALSDYLRSADRHRLVAGSLGLLTVGENALFLALALLTRLDLFGLLAARVVAQLAALSVLCYPSRGLLAGRMRAETLRALFAIGFPLGVFHLLIAVRSVDRVVIARLATLFDAGCYDVAARFAAPVALSNVALNLTLEPLAYRLSSDAGARAAIADFLRVYAALFGVLTFAIAVLAPELFGWFAPAYASGAIIVPALLFVDVAEGVQRVAGIPGELAKRTRLWLGAAAVNAALSLALMPLAVPRLGPTGAALALLSGAIAGSLVASALARRVHPARLPVGRALGVVVSGAALGSFALGMGRAAPLALGLRLGLVVVFAVVAWLVSGLSWQTLRRRAAELRAR